MATKNPANHSTNPATVEEYMALPYRLEITRGSYGSFVVEYPDLPGCMTQVETLEEAPSAAQEILEGWLEVALEDGLDIPLPGAQEKFSGKFVMRISKSLHRQLVLAARTEGVSLNQYSAQLLAAGHTVARVERKLDELCEKMDSLDDHIRRHEVQSPSVITQKRGGSSDLNADRNSQRAS